jgi:hypothetical protein
VVFATIAQKPAAAVIFDHRLKTRRRRRTDVAAA